MAKSWNVLNWNIRGINDPKKWTTVNNKIEESQCAILCLQETKRETFGVAYIRNFCPTRFNKFEYLPSIGASGGLLVVWNGALFSGKQNFQNRFSMSIQFTSHLSQQSWILANIYGPCDSGGRQNFLHWLANIQMPHSTDWILAGDFNYIRHPLIGMMGRVTLTTCYNLMTLLALWGWWKSL